VLVRAHVYTWWLWICFRVAETVDGHCGYNFPWSPYRVIPMSGSSAYHDFHHSHNVGNYSSFFTWWDTLMGTNQAYRVFVRKLKEGVRAPNPQPQAAGQPADQPAAGSPPPVASPTDAPPPVASSKTD